MKGGLLAWYTEGWKENVLDLVSRFQMGEQFGLRVVLQLLVLFLLQKHLYLYLHLSLCLLSISVSVSISISAFASISIYDSHALLTDG